ncbi:MAG TPA: hypothetical protein VEL74_00605 [Thermoanaerobaculia bacterium]|nr:hypothetical protein [Thermoanaerobaculia bacterium]
MFPVLLHPDLYRRLRQSAPGVRARVRKALLRLREGHWGGGTRVKRLRGMRRPVYEARSDSGDRLLFTVVRSSLPDNPDQLVCHLQVWDLVEHDDVDRAARRNRSPEAEFLELDAVEEFEIHEPPPHPEASFDELPTEPGGEPDAAEPLLQFLLPPDSFAPHAEEGIEGGIRWYRLDSALLAGEDEFQRLLDEGGEEIELKLTREQYEVLAAPGPVLLAGSAGSGKTSIAVHRLVQASLDPEAPRCLYLSYSAPLVEHAKRLYRDVVLARGANPKQNPPDFFTFGDLYLSLIPRDFKEHQARPMGEPLFREWFRKAGRSLDPALVWEELRSILKGACLSATQPMLDEETYFDLGRKRAPLFVDERPEIYRIAQRYQAWLAEEGRSDRIDLCRRALTEQRRRAKTYPVVVCDEVQDLTELEVAFVLSLSSRPDLAGVLLAGDAQQIVNPSGFRWAEVRRLAGKQARAKTAPPVLRLRRNLRSVRPVVELANTLLLLRRETFGRSEEDEPEEAAIAGPVPFEVAAGEQEVLDALEGFGPRCAVLTLDEEESRRLRRRLGTTRVFHVREAKGLEFDSVVLWKLLAPDRDLVERFVRLPRGESRLEREPRFARLLRHLYVAVTRARRHLAIYEGGTPHPFWSQERFRASLERGAVESLPRLFRATASPEVWEEEGDYFLERGHLRQAAECYRRAGAAEKEAEALARVAEAAEDWATALAHWTKLGLAERQAPILERLGRYAEALVLYRNAGLEREARLCELRLLERDKAWKEAAAGWEELGFFQEASRCWAQAGEERRALAAGARAAEAAGDWARAAAAWLELGDHAAAARCFAAAGDPVSAALALAHLHEKAGEWRRAAAAYRRAGRATAALRCRAQFHEESGRLDRAGRAREHLGESERAVDLYARAGRWLDVARLEGVGPLDRQRTLARVRELAESGGWDEAGELARTRLQALQPHLPEVPWFVAAAGERFAWQEHGLLGDLEIRCQALRAESQEAWSRATRLWRQVGEGDRAITARTRRIERIEDPLRRARAWVAAGDVERALSTLEQPGASPAAQLMAAAWKEERTERWSDAAALWKALGRPRDESRCLQKATERKDRKARQPAASGPRD